MSTTTTKLALAQCNFTSQSPQRRTSSLHCRDASFSSIQSFSSRHSRAGSSVSLVFDLEMEDFEPSQPVPRLPQEFNRLLYPTQQGAKTLWLAALQARAALADDDTSVDVHAFSQTLADMGHTIWLRKGTFNCPSEYRHVGGHVENTFVVAALSGDVHNAQPTYCVLDPNWLDHFRLAGQGAEEYNQLLSLLPPVFVGCASSLVALVTLLCKQMEKVFHGRGVSLPPWRAPMVMQGRWLVNQAIDTPIARAAPLPEAQLVQESAALVEAN